MSNDDCCRLLAIDQIMPNRTNIEVHIAYPSAIKNTKKAAFFAKMASPLSLSNPPGNVNPAVKVIVARRVATSDIMSRICVRSAFSWIYVYGSNPIMSHICFHSSSWSYNGFSNSIAVFPHLSFIVRSTSSILSNSSAKFLSFLFIAS
uniref:Uncharacterized protein n=1 Tax=Opuntia streptacantha TaxID=393608 RepID=A0A7C9AVR8_OPUST